MKSNNPPSELHEAVAALRPYFKQAALASLAASTFIS